MSPRNKQQRQSAQSVTGPTHIKDLTPDPANRRSHNPRNMGQIVDALHEVGAARSIVIDENGVILAGNGVTEAAAEAGITKLRVIDAAGDELIAVRRSGLSDEQKRYLAIADNRTGELATWNSAQFKEDLEGGLDFGKFFSADELAAILAKPVGGDGADGGGGDTKTLSDRFGVPPFSVLDARQGYWQDRKRAWLALGIESELGRGGGINSQSKMALELAGGFQNHPAHKAMNLDGRTDGREDRTLAAPHVRRSGNAAPGGSPRPAMTLNHEGKTQRGDGRGRPLASPGH